MTWLAYAMLSATFTALRILFIRLGVRDSDIYATEGIRSLIATVFLLVINIVMSKGDLSQLGFIRNQNLVWIMLSGIAGGFSWLFYLSAMKKGSVSQVATTDMMTLMITLVLCAVFLGEAFGLRTMLGSVIISLGIYFVVTT